MQTTKSGLLGMAFFGIALAVVPGSQAQNASDNLLINSGLNGQSANFQSTKGPFAPGWSYLPGVNPFPGSGYFVSQTVPTQDLYFYDVSLNLNISSGENPQFILFWDGTPIFTAAASSPGWDDYVFQETAAGTDSSFGIVGNSSFWSSVDNLNVYWNGGIDPPIPDGPVGIWMETAIVGGLCFAARGWRTRKTA